MLSVFAVLALRMKREKIFILSLFLGIFLVAFVCITLGNMFYTQARDISALIEAAKDMNVLEAIWISISAASTATLIAFIFGTPLAYFLARKEFFGKSVIEGIVDVPLMIPHIVAGIALYAVFMRYGVLGAPLQRLGLAFQDAFAGIVVAMLFVSFPLFVDAAKEGFKQVDPRFESVARSLGASQLRTFFEVTFPLASPSIISGAIMCWGRAISEFSAVLVLASFPRSAPVLIYERFTSYGLKAAMPVAVLLISICLLIFVLLRLLGTKAGSSKK
ncbi:MAG: ABC transporter permease [Candidatus Methanospirare jalkutatii]|nr:ABC transporter permease [Candidatus Methanospirare jalkutatii]